MLSLKHCSGPVDPKFKIFLVHLLRGPKIREGGGQTSLGQKPKYKFLFFLKPPLIYVFTETFQGPIVVLYLHLLDQSHQSLGIETNTKHSTYICGENINVA